MDKYDYISSVANRLAATGNQMVAKDLADDLNTKSYTTDRGNEFVGGIGIYKVISTAYHRCEDAGRDQDAHNIAVSFTKPDGSFAWRDGDEDNE